MKKIVFLITMLVAAVTATKAQEMAATTGGRNAILLQPAGSYIFYGDQVMDRKDCLEFLSTRCQPACETFQSAYKCYSAGWWTLGAGLAVDLAGSLLVAYGPIKNNDAMFWSGASFIIAGGIAVLASIPTIYIGSARMYRAIDMFNVSQATAPQTYWTIQGSQNGIRLALHF